MDRKSDGKTDIHGEANRLISITWLRMRLKRCHHYYLHQCCTSRLDASLNIFSCVVLIVSSRWEINQTLGTPLLNMNLNGSRDIHLVHLRGPAIHAS